MRQAQAAGGPSSRLRRALIYRVGYHMPRAAGTRGRSHPALPACEHSCRLGGRTGFPKRPPPGACGPQRGPESEPAGLPSRPAGRPAVPDHRWGQGRGLAGRVASGDISQTAGARKARGSLPVSLHSTRGRGLHGGGWQ